MTRMQQLAQSLADRKLARAGVPSSEEDEAQEITDDLAPPVEDETKVESSEDSQDESLFEDEGEDEAESEGTEQDEPTPLEQELEALRQRLTQREHELASLQGRLAPTQQRLSESETLAETYHRQLQATQAEKDAEIARLQAQIEENSRRDITDLLTEEEKELLDPEAVEVLIRMTDELIKRRVPKIDIEAEVERKLQERETQKIDDYRRQILSDPSRGLHELVILSENPEFNDWLKQDGNESFNLHVTALLRANSTSEIDKHARIIARKINQFKKPTQNSPKKADPRQSLKDKMRRRPNRRMSEAEVKEKLAEANRLVRAGRIAEAKAIHDSIK